MSFFCGIMFVGLKRVLWPANIKINHQRTELCNISIFGSIFLPVRTEVEWVWISLWNHVPWSEASPLGGEHPN
jgi:hypothetical protein